MSYQFTEVGSGGINHVGLDEPTPEQAALWAEIIERIDGTQAAGANESWSHSLHTNTVTSVFARDGVVYSGSSDDTVKAATPFSEFGDLRIGFDNKWLPMEANQ